MELDELKAIWTRDGQRLERMVRLNAEGLRQLSARRSGRSLRKLFGGTILELVQDFVGILLIGSFAADHSAEPAFFVPALLLGAYAIAIFAAVLSQAVALGAIRYDEPVVAIQGRLEALRVRRIRTTLGALLFAPLMWVPLAIVVARGFFGVDLYAVADPGWLAINGLFGLALIPAAIFVARRFGRHLRESSLGRALADEIAGRSLAAALDDLAAIGRFAEDG
ncbi:MAG TPA: hypothetical protein VGI15_08295 [Candidatus Cybelea sp.]